MPTGRYHLKCSRACRAMLECLHRTLQEFRTILGVSSPNSRAIFLAPSPHPHTRSSLLTLTLCAGYLPMNMITHISPHGPTSVDPLAVLVPNSTSRHLSESIRSLSALYTTYTVPNPCTTPHTPHPCPTPHSLFHTHYTTPTTPHR